MDMLILIAAYAVRGMGATVPVDAQGPTLNDPI
jgi:hypothetical protein